MKVFSVEIEAICTVVVLAESEDDALEVACAAPSYGDFTLVTGGPAEEIAEDGQEDENRERYIRHADMIVDGQGRELKASAALSLLTNLEAAQ